MLRLRSLDIEASRSFPGHENCSLNVNGEDSWDKHLAARDFSHEEFKFDMLAKCRRSGWPGGDPEGLLIEDDSPMTSFASCSLGTECPGGSATAVAVGGE